ncbi:MAG: hypothetical protein ACO1PZ_05560 [Gammaproteobacteria bacterium]
MGEHADKAQERKQESTAEAPFQRAGGPGPVSAIADRRPEATAQRRLQQAASNSPGVQQLKGIQQRVMGGQAQAAPRTPSATQSGPAPVQRLKWSEVQSDKPKENVEIAASQIPDGVAAVEGEGATADRNVWAGQQKKGRSGFLWHRESTLEIEYDVKAMQQYRIIDPTVVFYTAVRQAAVEPIKKNGIDPNYGNAEKPDGPSQYNTRGFNYFGKDRKIPNLYGSYLEPAPWTILSFRLPEGTLIERDPEIPNGLRTQYHIKPSDLA